MSIVRYCINLDELSNYLKDFLTKPKQFICPYGYLRSKGFRIKSEKKHQFDNEIISVPINIPYEEYVITGMSINIPTLNDYFTEKNIRGNDYFNFVVNGENVFDTVYLKDIEKYANFRRPFRVTQKMIDDGLTMSIEYKNNTKDTIQDEDGNVIEIFKPFQAWFVIDYMVTQYKLTEVIVSYVDENGEEIESASNHKFSEGLHRVEALDIEGYYLVGKYYQEFLISYDKNNVDPLEIIFQYVKKER